MKVNRGLSRIVKSAVRAIKEFRPDLSKEFRQWQNGLIHGYQGALCAFLDYPNFDRSYRYLFLVGRIHKRGISQRKEER